MPDSQTTATEGQTQATDSQTQTGPAWSSAIFDALSDAGIAQVAYVPDAGHRHLIQQAHANPDMTAIPLTTEAEGPAVLAGAWLGGQRGVLLMQSSGVGNCPNMLATTQTCRFPLLMLVTMRGEFGEFNPWQLPMGRAAGPMLELMGCHVIRLEPADRDRVGEITAAAARMAFEGQVPVAILISQALIGAKAFATDGDSK